MNRRFIALLIVLSIFGTMTGGFAAHGAESKPISDITGHWAADKINKYVSQGLIKGYEDGTFHPDDPITRAEFISLVSQITKIKDHLPSASFTDVGSTHWAAKAVGLGVRQGFLKSADIGDQFHPSQQLTRREMVRWMVNGLMTTDVSYVQSFEDTKDVILPFTEYYRNGIQPDDVPYIALGLGTGLIGGFPDGSFGPNLTTTRAEVVALLSRYQEIEGTPAKQYRDLNELREVGTTGTNLTTIAGAGWDDPINHPFTDAFNVPLQSNFYNVELFMHHYIVVNRDFPSVYSKMFLTQEEIDEDLAYEHKYYPDEKSSTFFAYMETTITPHDHDLTYGGFSASQTYVTGSKIPDEKIDQYGFNAIKTDNWPMFKKDETYRFWSTSTISSSDLVVRKFKLADGTVLGFKIWDCLCNRNQVSK